MESGIKRTDVNEKEDRVKCMLRTRMTQPKQLEVGRDDKREE